MLKSSVSIYVHSVYFYFSFILFYLLQCCVFFSFFFFFLYSVLQLLHYYLFLSFPIYIRHHNIVKNHDVNVSEFILFIFDVPQYLGPYMPNLYVIHGCYRQLDWSCLPFRSTRSHIPVSSHVKLNLPVFKFITLLLVSLYSMISLDVLPPCEKMNKLANNFGHNCYCLLLLLKRCRVDVRRKKNYIKKK